MASGSTSPFQPSGTVSIAASTTSTNVALPQGGDVVLITNPSAAIAYISFGSDPSVTASSSGVPVLPSSRLLLRCGPLVTWCAAVLSSGTGTVIATRGDGSSV